MNRLTQAVLAATAVWLIDEVGIDDVTASTRELVRLGSAKDYVEGRVSCPSADRLASTMSVIVSRQFSSLRLPEDPTWWRALLVLTMSEVVLAMDEVDD